MENKVIIKEYLGNNIEFKVVDGLVYANANKMAVGFGGSQKLADWKRSENTKRYIGALEKQCRDKLGEISIVYSEEGRNGGTWIHEKLILNFARYLNVEFELWCDEQITTLLREGTVSIDQKQNLLLSVIQAPSEIERAVALNKYELEYVKPLEENLEKTTKKLEHKQEVIDTMVEDVKLKTQRQFLVEIIKMKPKHIKERWTMLYKAYEHNKHINLNARYEGYNLINSPKLKSKLEYIDKVANDIPFLYGLAVKMFECDFKDKLQKYIEVL